MKFVRRTYDDSYFTTPIPESIQQTYAKAKFVLLYKHKGTLLEIGFGDGALLYELSKTFDVEGIEISRHALQRARTYFKNPTTLQIIDIQSTELEKQYDIIVALDVLEHLRDPKQALIRIKNGLRDNGVCIFSVPNNYGLFGSIATRVMNYFDKTHISTLRRTEWMHIVQELGFETIAVANKTMFGIHRAEWTSYVSSSFIMVLKKS